MLNFRVFSNQPQTAYPVAVLAPKLEADGIIREYIQDSMLTQEEVIAYQLFTDGKKTKSADMKNFLDHLLPELSQIGTEYLLVTDGEYFKTLTGTKKAAMALGYVLPNKYPEDMAGQFNVVYVPNYRQVIYNPAPTRAKINLSLDALHAHRNNAYEEPGDHLLKEAHYPSNLTDIAVWLDRLIEWNVPLTCDTEGFSLKPHTAGIGTIAFAWSKHSGIAFAVDLGSSGQAVRDLLKDFFQRFNHTITYHNISYDGAMLIAQLWMESIIDQEGLLTGLDVILKNWDDTKIISYLATNSCAGNDLGLKDQAQEFAGDYAVEEIKDITKIPLPQLLEYNLVDACSTWFVKEKHWQTMIDDQQGELYHELFKPIIVDIIQMQLTGMPLDMDQVHISKAALERDREKALKSLSNTLIVTDFETLINEEKENKRYADWEGRKAAGIKVRPYTPGKNQETFNPNSAPQLQKLFYEMLELPVVEKTKSDMPATSGEVLEKLKAYTDSKSIIGFIDQLLAFKAVDKILGTFIKAMLEDSIQGPDGVFYLFGNFNLGGTVSGRLSSSNPNLQTIPSTATGVNEAMKEIKAAYVKLIKKCFKAPKGWVMIGLDFDSLEDRISALTTKDPNKLKVYTDGFDGHCLRAQSYFGEQMPDIDPASVDSINSIKKKYPALRQDSKMPTFALTYQGTYITLMAKGGFSEIVAKQIEARYHELYKASDEWVDEKLEEASRVGYITAAFGLRVRTPLLAQVVRNNSRMPHEAKAEGRTAGNALGQSWCLLNSRASVEFMRKVRASKYRLLIKPIAHIHDAQYYLIPDDIDVLQYVNKHLVKAVQWQDHPDIWHDEVKLGGEVSVFYPSWANEIPIKNGASADEIRDTIANTLNPQKEAA